MNNKITKLKKKKGFTLIELIIVIAIIGIIAAIAIPNFAKVQANAKIDADIATARTISNAVTVLITDGTITNTAIVATPMTIDLNVGVGSINATNTAGSNGAKIESYVKTGALKLQTPGAVAALTITVDTDGSVTTITEKVKTDNILYPAPVLVTGKTNIYLRK